MKLEITVFKHTHAMMHDTVKAQSVRIPWLDYIPSCTPATRHRNSLDANLVVDADMQLKWSPLYNLYQLIIGAFLKSFRLTHELTRSSEKTTDPRILRLIFPTLLSHSVSQWFCPQNIITTCMVLLCSPVVNETSLGNMYADLSGAAVYRYPTTIGYSRFWAAVLSVMNAWCKWRCCQGQPRHMKMRRQFTIVWI